MKSDPPLLDHDRYTRAAEAMIANYGSQALAEAVKRARAMRSSGCDTTADTWDYICKIIRARFGVYALVGRALTPDLLEPEMAEGMVTRFSFFDVH